MIDSDAEEKAAAVQREAELAQLHAWMNLTGGQKIDFFEEMLELAYHSGALRPERLALRDRSPPEDGPTIDPLAVKFP